MATTTTQHARSSGTSAKQTVVITGAAGYLGSRILAAAQADARVGRIIAIDCAPSPNLEGVNTERVRWIRASLDDRVQWEEALRREEPHAVIHAAWRVRIPYQKEAEVRAENLLATRSLAQFALSAPSVRAFVFVSSAAVFGAFASNHPDYTLCEADVPREEEYPYAAQKREAEEMLCNLWRERNTKTPALRIARPVSIVGAAARKRKEAFALTALLAGLAEPSSNPFGRAAQRVARMFPAPTTWRRQYVHEDDVARALLALALEVGRGAAAQPMLVYHLAPPGGALSPQEFARLTGRAWLRVAPSLVRLAFWGAWHLSRGAVPTCRGVWRFYSYPIVLDGGRITRDFSFVYQWPSSDALRAMLAGGEAKEV